MRVVSTDKAIPLLLDGKSMRDFEVTHAASMHRFLEETSESLKMKGKSQGVSLFFFLEWYTKQQRLHKLPPMVAFID